MKGLKKFISGIISLTLISGITAGIAESVSASVVTTAVEEQTVDVSYSVMKKMAGTATLTSKNKYWQINSGNAARFLVGTIESKRLTGVIMNLYSKASIPAAVYLCEQEAVSEDVMLKEGTYICLAEKTIKTENGNVTFEIPADMIDSAKSYYVYFSIDNTTGSTGARINSAQLVYEEETTVESDFAQIAEGVTLTEKKLDAFPDSVGFVTNITSARSCSKINYTLKAEGKQAQTRTYDLSIFDEESEADCNLGIVVENVPDTIDIKCSATVE